MARPFYVPDEKDYKTVQAMAAVGMPQADICTVLGIDGKTLRKHFREELDRAEIKANAKVSATMFQMATSGQHPGMTAFWMKCRMRWKEPIAQLELSGPGGTAVELNVSARDTLAARIAGVAARLGTDEAHSRSE